MKSPPKTGFSILENSTPQIGARSNPVAAKKIKKRDELAEIIADLKAQGRIIVQCHGVFDLLHPGHIRHLVEARSQGNILVVTLTADKYVNKGPGRPIFNHHLRAETLASMECVDFVVINESATAISAIKQLRPDVYVKGDDYKDPKDDVTGKIVDENETVDSVGGRIYFTKDITFSSSSLINQALLPFPPETERWLKAFQQKHSEKDVLDALGSLSNLKVLVLGEAIIDEYVFCSGMGKAAKDPILAFLHKTEEAIVGGSLAIANHLADFCRDVEIVTLIGETESREEFISRSLHPNVTWHGITQKGAPTLSKRRFVDDHTGAKIFELYHMDETPLDEGSERELLDAVGSRISNFDLVIVADYGHGVMTPALIDLVCRKAKFLALNTQTNAGNRGFNTASKYLRADYICIAGHEMDLETRDRESNDSDKIKAMAANLNCLCFTVTLGRRGSLHYEKGLEPTRAPAVAPKVVDLVGAGDAVLAITSGLVANGTSWEIVGFIGNVAGAEMVSDLGNRISLSKTNLSKHLITLLK